MAQYIDVQPRFSQCTINWMKPGVSVPPLRYKLQPMSSSQKRLHGRMVIEPQIDLSRYTCNSVIDWIWLEFETKRPTGSSNLRKHLKCLFGETHIVLGPDAEHNDEADWNEIGRRFRMKIQDPQPWPIYRLPCVIDAFRGLAGPIRILGMELALDWKPNDASDAARWQMVATLQRHHLPMIRGLDAPDCDLRHTYQRMSAKRGNKDNSATEFVIHDRRLNASKEGSDRAFSDLDLDNEKVRKRVLRVDGHRAPFIDSTVYRGADEGEILFRIQNKETDQRNRKAGTVKMLTQEEKRARVEVRLLDAAVAEAGFCELRDLFDARFTRLRKPFFPFWKATVPGGGTSGSGSLALTLERNLRKTLCTVFDASGVYGAKLYEEASVKQQRANRKARQKPGEKQGRAERVYQRKHGHLCAWEEMTGRTGRALELLGEKWAAVTNERRLPAPSSAQRKTAAERVGVAVEAGADVSVSVGCGGTGSRVVDSSGASDSGERREEQGADENAPQGSPSRDSRECVSLGEGEAAETSACFVEDSSSGEQLDGQWDREGAEEQDVLSHESVETEADAAGDDDNRSRLNQQGQVGCSESVDAELYVRIQRGENLSPTADSAVPCRNIGQEFSGGSLGCGRPRQPGHSLRREDVAAEVEHEERGACAPAT